MTTGLALDHSPIATASTRIDPVSEKANPASRYRQRNQNGSTRAFQRRACGAKRKISAESTAMIVRNMPTRWRRMKDAKPPRAARMNNHSRWVGKRFLV